PEAEEAEAKEGAVGSPGREGRVRREEARWRPFVLAASREPRGLGRESSRAAQALGHAPPLGETWIQDRRIEATVEAKRPCHPSAASGRVRTCPASTRKKPAGRFAFPLPSPASSID